MRDIIKKNRVFLISTLAVVLISALVTMAVPLYINVRLDDSSAINFETVIIIIGLMMFSLALQLALIFIRENYAAKFNIANFKNSCNKMFEMNYDELLKKEPTSLIERIGMLTNSVYMFITSSFSSIVSGMLVILVSLIFILRINIFLGLLLTIVVPVNYFGFKSINKILNKKCEVLQRSTSEGYKEIIGLCKYVDFIKQTSDHSILIDKIHTPLKKIYYSMANINQFAQASSSAIKMFNSFVQNIVLIILYLNVVNFGQGLTALVIVSIVLPLFFGSLGGIVSTNLEVANLRANMDFIKDEIEAAREENGTVKISSIDSIRVDLSEFYLAGNVKRVNIHAEFSKGDVVNIKGISGSGKSTFIKLFLKFRGVKSIYVNQIDISQIDNESLREKIAYVSQDTAVFPFTIRENIEIGSNKDVDWEKVSQSKLLAPVLRDKTLDTRILENGANLSGGERQRIALCRELQNTSDLIILDEITSNLDPEAAQLIYDDILEQYKDKIILIIRHETNTTISFTKELIIDLHRD